MIAANDIILNIIGNMCGRFLQVAVTFLICCAWGGFGKADISAAQLKRQFFYDIPPDMELYAGWQAELPSCTLGSSYRFEAEFFRETCTEEYIYPVITIWGQRITLDTHRMIGRYQTLHARVKCPSELQSRDMFFSFEKNGDGIAFYMKNPRLVQIENSGARPHVLPEERLFPIGAYGAVPGNLEKMRSDGLSTAVIGLNRESVEACLVQGMHCTFAVPHDPQRLLAELVALKPLLKGMDFAFYVNDEPGIHSFPRQKAEKIQRIIKEQFPDKFTNMAIVRPHVVPEYQDSADYFMLDQYPVPDMPMIWLSDSLDSAAGYVGRERLQSVIQAFGGGRFAASGWPRLPTFEEMNCLAFLSIVHGSRGVYFFTYPEITATAEGHADFRKVVARLNSLRSWLEQNNLSAEVGVKMTSRYTTDQVGNPAVHCAGKVQYGTKMLICVNVLRTEVEAGIALQTGDSRQWLEYFSDERYTAVEDNLRVRFQPLAVKVLMEDRAGR